MGKAKKWLKDSHRWQHFVGGLGVGLMADDWYCAGLAGCGVAGALEFKDWQASRSPDVIDFALTASGTAIGFGIRFCIELCLKL